MPILRCDEKRAPAVTGRLIDVSPCSQKDLHRLQVVGAGRIHEGGQLATVGRTLAVKLRLCCCGLSLPAGPGIRLDSPPGLLFPRVAGLAKRRSTATRCGCRSSFDIGTVIDEE